MLGLWIDVQVFSFMRSGLAKCCSAAKMNSQMGDGQVKSAFIFLGHFLRMAN
jgi:hypothetical protein